jgi:F1F0 ATPase subunit 2
MYETVNMLLALMGGILLGAFFFGGLWWTVQKGLRSQHPALWFFVSFLLRTSITLAGLYCVSGGHWQRLIACLLGCILARLIVTWLSRMGKQGGLSRGTGHAA